MHDHSKIHFIARILMDIYVGSCIIRIFREWWGMQHLLDCLSAYTVQGVTSRAKVIQNICWAIFSLTCFSNEICGASGNLILITFSEISRKSALLTRFLLMEKGKLPA